MAGICQCMGGLTERCEELPHRNATASILSGILFGIGLWLWIDGMVLYSAEEIPTSVHLVACLTTCGHFMVNSISNSQVADSALFELNRRGLCFARIWMFLGFLILFSSLIGSLCIFGIMYLFESQRPLGAGVLVIAENLIIVLSALLFKFGRREEALY